MQGHSHSFESEGAQSLKAISGPFCLKKWEGPSLLLCTTARASLGNSSHGFHLSFTKYFGGSQHQFLKILLNKLIKSSKIHGFHYNITKKINGFRGTRGTRSNEAPVLYGQTGPLGDYSPAHVLP